MATQLSLEFPKSDKYLLENFIPHSGVVETFNLLQDLKSKFVTNKKNEGNIVLIFGPEGSGKTHIANALFANSAETMDVSIFDFEVSSGKFYENNQEITIERFVATFQSLKLKEKLLLVLTRGPLIRDEIDPHIYSRLVSGQICEINYPPEEELLPVLKCILERHGMRLEDKELSKIINQVPAVPECFTSVCEELEQILVSGEKYRPSLLKSILSK